MQLASPIHYETPRLANFAGDVDEVEVSLLCADVVSFTEMTGRLGDTRALMVMRSVANTVRQAARRHRGELLEIRGDAFLLAFASPRDAGRCALRVMRALALDLDFDTGERVRIRMALHTGTVVRDGNGYFGRAVILAYRLLSQAAAGQIAVSSSVARRLPSRWQARVEDRGSFQPKGFQNQVDFLLLAGSPHGSFAHIRNGRSVRDGPGHPEVQIPCYASAHGAD